MTCTANFEVFFCLILQEFLGQATYTGTLIELNNVHGQRKKVFTRENEEHESRTEMLTTTIRIDDNCSKL